MKWYGRQCCENLYWRTMLVVQMRYQLVSSPAGVGENSLGILHFAHFALFIDMLSGAMYNFPL